MRNILIAIALALTLQSCAASPTPSEGCCKKEGKAMSCDMKCCDKGGTQGHQH